MLYVTPERNKEYVTSLFLFVTIWALEHICYAIKVTKYLFKVVTDS